MLNPYKKIMLLDSDEVVELIEEAQSIQYKSSTEARDRCQEIINKIVEAHTGIVIQRINHFVKNVFKTSKSREVLELLYQEGIVGLMSAFWKFDTTYGTKFSTYAVYYIDKAIRVALKSENETVHYPLWTYDYHNREEDNDHSKSTELAIKYQRNLNTSQRYAYIEVDDFEKQNHEVSSVILESEMAVLSNDLSEQELYTEAVRIKRVLDTSLTEREIKVLYRNLITQESLQKIAEDYNITGEGIRAVLKDASDNLEKNHGLSTEEVVLGLSFYDFVV